MSDDPKKPEEKRPDSIPLDDRWQMDAEEAGEIIIIRDGEEISLDDLESS